MKFSRVKKTTKQLVLFSFGILVLLIAKEILLGGEVQNQTQIQILGQNEIIDAPDFTLSDIEGKIRNLRDLQGRFVLLNFWTTWWGYCERERSSLEKIHQLYSKKGVVVLAVSIDRGNDEEVRKLVKGYVQRRKLTFLNLLDPKSEVASQYGVRGIPMTFLINPQGKVVAFAGGYIKWDSKKNRKIFEQFLSGINTEFKAR